MFILPKCNKTNERAKKASVKTFQVPNRGMTARDDESSGIIPQVCFNSIAGGSTYNNARKLQIQTIHNHRGKGFERSIRPNALLEDRMIHIESTHWQHVDFNPTRVATPLSTTSVVSLARWNH